MTLQKSRTLTKLGFFILFLFAPLLNIFRFDLDLGHFIIFGQAWTITIDPILHGGGDAVDAAIKIFTRVLIPGMAFVAVAGILIWKFGRIYCGWLCPHFSVVELINELMLKHLNRVTIWEKASKASKGVLPWIIVFTAAISVAFIWAVGLLSYLLDPQTLLIDLVHGNLGFGSTIFISAATTVFTLDFLFARHLFCKYGCALGIFQSLIWMANKQAQIVKFNRKRAKTCRECIQNSENGNPPCDEACPMRLPTRNMKRAKFTCTQCVQCISACSEAQKHNPDGSLLTWVNGEQAIEVDRSASKYKENDISAKKINIKEIK